MHPAPLTPWLTFTDPAREHRYRQEQHHRIRPHLLATLAVGTAVFILFGLVDFMLAQAHIRVILWMRYGLILPPSLDRSRKSVYLLTMDHGAHAERTCASLSVR